MPYLRKAVLQCLFKKCINPLSHHSVPKNLSYRNIDMDMQRQAWKLMATLFEMKQK